MCAGNITQQQIADQIVSVMDQRPQGMGIVPLVDIGRKTEFGGETDGKGAAEESGRAHVLNPPWQAVVMKRRTIILKQDKAIRAHRKQHAKPTNLSLG